MSYIDHAEREFKALGWRDDDEMQNLVCDNVVELLKVFSGQGHSGHSAPYVVNLFRKAALFKPLSPLTGEESEWMEYADGLFQNVRDSSVFKDGKDGQAYWSGGRVFREPNGVTYVGKGSRVPIEFPWTRPEQPEIVDVPFDED